MESGRTFNKLQAHRGLKWLIIEDGLRDLHGHFLDFVATFRRGLTALGDRVTVLCDRDASPAVIEQTGALPLLPGANLRLGSLRSPVNVLQNIYWIIASLAVLLKFRRVIDESDMIFLTAVRLQHLIVWRLYSLIRGKRFQTPMLLFFMATPVREATDGSKYQWEGLKGRAVGALVKSLGCGSVGDKMTFATETEQLSECLSDLCGIHFLTLPQPVEVGAGRQRREKASESKSVTIGSFGPPREEKGSHLLVKAIAMLLAESPLLPVRFIVQWTEDFMCSNGEVARIAPELVGCDRLQVIPHYFAAGEYDELLEETDAVVLPYGSNYRLRGSRVLIDALVRGLPVAVTAGSSMQALAECYGKCVLIRNWTASCLADTLRELIEVARGHSHCREGLALAAKEYFSVAEFRRRLLAKAF